MAAGNSEIKTYFGRCRCCLNYGYLKNMWDEHFWEGEKEIYVEMLVQCFALSWEHSEDSMEHDQICEACITRLRDANNFKKTVLDSQEELLGQLDDACIEIEVEQSPKNPDSSIKIEKVEYVVEDKNKSKNESVIDDSIFIDDPDDPDYVDPDDPDPDDPNNMEYEEVEYLEEEDVGAAPSKPERRAKRPAEMSADGKWPRKLPKSERYKTYKQYTEEDLRKCLEAVRNEELTPTEASEKFNVPKKTILAKVKLNPKDVPNGNTTEEKNKNKPRQRQKPTIFRASLRKIRVKKMPAKIKTEVSTVTEVDEILTNIKSEENVPIDVTQVRNKYKAIVNEKFKKETKEPEKSDVNEMCKHKENIKNILECSNASIIKGFWGNGYYCLFCKVQKENPLDLKGHNLEVHGNIGAEAIKVKYVSDLVIRLDITGLKCKLCDTNIDALESLMDHLSKTHKKTMHRDIKNHIIPFKFESDILQCVMCRKEFKYFKLLSEHMSEHYRNYECKVCERAFINKQSMQTHSYRHKNGVFKCLHCPKIFDSRPKRSVHERVTHKLSNKSRKCTFCDERFSTKDLVKSHESKVHGAEIPIYNCQACNKSYNSQSTLITHQKRFHLMLRPHKCSYCDMAFFSRIELRSHTVTHTKTRNFNCNMCSKSFGTRCSLNQHVRGHLDDRRFKCESCDRAFVHRTAYRVHMRSKHGTIV